ncbi:hypothetical protein AYO40_05665 [Planctomycetaceae bacterium SCGC AG-212-D15]|nr:hypothetical protein AYO40_05665 [Planctomycetaceae bacterium SCGC AG-212-D15]
MSLRFGATVAWRIQQAVRQYWRNGVLCLMLAVLLANIWGDSLDLRKHGEPVSPRYYYYGIPLALSEIVYGRPRDYVGYKRVSNEFLNVFPPPRSDNVDLIIKKGSTIPAEEVQRSADWFIPGDDKGAVDFVRLAFWIFEVEYASLYKCYFGLLCIGILTYVMAFFKDLARLVFLALFLCSYYVFLFVIPLSDQLASILQPRFFDVLSVVPFCHLAFLLLDRHRWTVFHIVLACVQVSLLLFVIHARSSAMWQVHCLGVIVAGRILRTLHQQEVGGMWARLGAAGRATLAWIWPVGIVLMGVGALDLYKRASYHQSYFHDRGTNHIVWHNVLMGMSAHPGLAERYELPFMDDAATRAVKRWLLEHHDMDTLQGLFANPSLLENNFEGFNWVLYEPIARHVCWDICREAPRQVAATFLVYKPLVFWNTLLWTAGNGSGEAVTPPGGVQIASDSARNAADLYLKPFRAVPIGILLCVLLLRPTEVRGKLTSCVMVIALAFVGSAVPGILVVPFIHYIGVSLILLLMLGYLLALAVATAVVDRLAVRMRHGASVGE